MTRSVLLTVLLSFVSGAPDLVVAQESNPFKGAWAIDRVEGSEGEVLLEDPEPALVLFTETHFSYLMVFPPDQERSTYSGDVPTEAEQARALESLDGGAGRYEAEGDSVLVTRAYIHMNPDAMAEWPDRVRTYDVQLESEEIRWPIGPSAVAVFRKVEGTPPPY